MNTSILHGLTRFGVLASHPLAFAVFALYAVSWYFIDPETFDWHAVATLVTLCMTLFIQRAEHRDTQAIHAKLDELLRADTNASTELGRLDEEEPEDIEQHRKEIREGKNPSR